MGHRFACWTSVGVVLVCLQTKGCFCEEAVEVSPADNAVVCTCTCGVDVVGQIVCSQDPFRAGEECEQTVSVCIPASIQPAGDGGTFTQPQLEDLCQLACDEGALAVAQEFAVASGNANRACDLQCPSAVGGRGVAADAVVFRDESCADLEAGTDRAECREEPCDLETLFADGASLDETRTALKTCTQAVENTAECELPERPTEPICLVQDSDPPIPRSVGFASRMTQRISVGIVDSSESFIHLLPAGGPEDGVQSSIAGRVEFTGRPCPNAACEVGFFVTLSADDTSFPFSISDVPSGELILEAIRISAQTTPAAVSLDAFGTGQLPAGEIMGTARARATRAIAGVGAEEDVAFFVQPTESAFVNVDFVNGTFALSGLFSFAEDATAGRPALDAAFTIVGELESGPPTAVAGENLVVECTELGGATVVLDGSDSVDPDGDIAGYAWHSGMVPVASASIGTGPLVEVQQSLGSAEYLLTVSDARMQMDFDTIEVTVTDTTPPTLSELVNAGPACIWPPRHDYVVLRVGQELRGIVEDACDPNAELVIKSATSDQPDDALGDGSTTSDVVVFPDHVCLRAERQGMALEGRQYSLSLVARDAAGNEADPVLTIRVAHDQSEHDCPRIDATLFVAEGDPLCVPPPPVEATAAGDATQAQHGPDGCSGVRPSSYKPLLWLSCLLLLRRRGRRTCAASSPS